jgi:hypothetical protein
VIENRYYKNRFDLYYALFYMGLNLAGNTFWSGNFDTLLFGRPQVYTGLGIHLDADEVSQSNSAN